MSTAPEQVAAPKIMTPAPRLVSRLVPDAAKTLALRIVSLLAQIAAFAFLARTHTLEAVGIFAAVSTLLVIARMAGPMGCDYAAYKYGSIYLERGDMRKLSAFARATTIHVARFSLVAAFAALWLGIVFANQIIGVKDTTVALVFALALPAYALAGLYSSMHRVRGDIIWAQLPDGLLLHALLLVGLGITYVNDAVDIRTTLAILAAAAWTTLVLSMLRWRIKVGPLTGTLPDEERREILYTARRIFAGTFVANLATRVPVILVSATLGPAAAGLFEAASRFGTLATLTSYASNAAVAPLLARARERNDPKEVQDLYTLGSLLHLVPALGILLILILFGGDLLALLLGEKFRAAALPMVLIAAYEAVAASGAVASPLLQMSGREMAVFNYSTRSLAISTVGIPIAGSWLGLPGAAGVLILCGLARDIGMARLAARTYGIRPGVLSLTEMARCLRLVRSHGFGLVRGVRC